MGRRGYGRVAMQGDIYRLNMESIDLHSRADSWESIARILAGLVLDRKYAKRVELSNAILAFPKYSKRGPEAIEAKFGPKPNLDTMNSFDREEYEALLEEYESKFKKNR